mgnify:FL=1
MTTEQQIQQAAEILAGAEKAVASCGAGISAESGIATFRDVGGVWDRMNPAEVGTTQGLIDTLSRDAGKLVPFFLELLDAFDQAAPNPAHKALAELEQMGILQTVVTQNIDNLHLEAGNTDVIEVHGNGFRMACLSCSYIETRDRRHLIGEARDKLQSMKEYSLAAMMEVMPQCTQCGAMMRPDVVMFGEMVKDIPRAFEAARKSDVMLAIGTSGVVYPAAYLPFEAKEAGAQVIVVNPNENPFSRISETYIPLNAGEAMPKLVEAVKTIKTG